jgi:hypothetical protein
MTPQFSPSPFDAQHGADWGVYEEDRLSDCILCGRAWWFTNLNEYLECPDCTGSEEVAT